MSEFSDDETSGYFSGNYAAVANKLAELRAEIEGDGK